MKKRDPRLLARVALFIAIPLVMALSYWLQQEEKTRYAIPGLRCMLPAGWNYMSRTGVSADTGHQLVFDSKALREALATGVAAPLFAAVKYRRARAGLNPLIGVNAALETAVPIPPAREILERSVADVQQRSGNGLRLVEDYTTTAVAGYPAAQVVLTADQPGAERADALTVIAFVAGQVSLMITASGAFTGDDAIDDELRAFLASIVIQK